MTARRLFDLRGRKAPQHVVDALEELGAALHNGGDYYHPKRREQIEAAAWRVAAEAADAGLIDFDETEGLEDLDGER